MFFVQDCNLGLILFNIFHNDCFLSLTKSELTNFVDYNTIIVTCDHLGCMTMFVI